MHTIINLDVFMTANKYFIWSLKCDFDCFRIFFRKQRFNVKSSTFKVCLKLFVSRNLVDKFVPEDRNAIICVLIFTLIFSSVYIKYIIVNQFFKWDSNTVNLTFKLYINFINRQSMSVYKWVSCYFIVDVFHNPNRRYEKCS